MKWLSPFFKIFFCLVFFLVLLAVVFDFGCGQALRVDVPQAPEKPVPVVETIFPPGEVIRFGIFSNIFKVGEGSLTYVGTDRSTGAAGQRVRMQIDTLSIDDIDEVVGTEDFSFPMMVTRDVRLFGRAERITETYTADHHGVTVTKTVKNAPARSQTIHSDESLENVLLMIYRLRNDPDLDIGKTYPINLPTQKFQLNVKSRITIKVPLGEFEVFYIESTPSKYKLWMTTDHRRLPVRIQGLVTLGMVYMAATSVETP